MRIFNVDRSSKFITHTFVWVMITVIPLLLMQLIFDTVLPFKACAVYVVSVLFHAFLFYYNYFRLIDVYVFGHRTLRYVAINFLLIMFINAAFRVFLVKTIGFPQQPLPDGPPPPEAWKFDYTELISNSGMLVFTLILSLSMRISERWKQEQLEKDRIEKARSEAELKNLRDKLNPHFLFNTLNNIYALTSVNPEKAGDAVLSLSDMLRFTLYDNGTDMVPLDKELEFTRHYIELMSLRLSPERTSLEVVIPQTADDRPVATLILVTLIENAFKHGVSARERSWIRLKVAVDGDFLKAEISNSLFPKSVSDRSGSGIGLDNLQRRLELLYSGRYEYTVNRDDTSYNAFLSIPLDK